MKDATLPLTITRSIQASSTEITALLRSVKFSNRCMSGFIIVPSIRMITMAQVSPLSKGDAECY